MKTYKMSGLLVSAIFAAALLGGCGSREPAPPKDVARPVRLLTVSGGEATASRSLPGKVRATQQVDLSFRVSGPLVELPITEGQVVEQDALLARIDPRDFETRLQDATSALEAARADLKAKQVGDRPEDIQILEANVSSATAALDKADIDFKRMDELLKKGAVAQSAYDQAKAARDVARANSETAQASLQRGKTGARAEDIEATEARIRGLEAQQQEAQSALGDTELKAPFAGVVAKKYVDNFAKVQAQQSILSLQDLSSVDVVIQVPERDFAKAPKREEVDFSGVVVTFDALPGVELTPSLKEFKTEADPQTQTYEVTLSVPQSDEHRIVPGMSAQVKGQIRKHAGAGVSVPVEAVVDAGEGKPYVWVVDEQTMGVRKSPVQVGAISGGDIEVVDGLKPGDVIAATGAHYLRDGMKVRAMDSEGR